MIYLDNGATSFPKPLQVSNAMRRALFTCANPGRGGYLAAMDATCSLEIQTVPGAKNMFFGGEGIFNTVVRGPGRVYLQTMPIISVANAIRPYIPTSNS